MITVCIPVYNMEKTLERTLNSCLIQNKDFDVEYLLVDNASTDNTYNIAQQFLGIIPNFTIIRNEVNIGAYANHNLCIENAKHEWIKFLHGDDELLPNSIEVLKTYTNSIDNHFIFFDYLGNTYYNDLKITEIISDNKIAKSLVIHGNFIGTPSTTIFRKKSFQNIGMFDLSLNPASDADAFFRLALNYGALFINKQLVKIDDDPFNGIILYENNRMMFLNNTFLQLDKWSKINSPHLQNIKWIDVYKKEAFRFFDASLILILRFRFSLFIKLKNTLINKRVFLKSLIFYTRMRLSGNNSAQIRTTKWFNYV